MTTIAIITKKLSEYLRESNEQAKELREFSKLLQRHVKRAKRLEKLLDELNDIESAWSESSANYAETALIEHIDNLDLKHTDADAVAGGEEEQWTKPLTDGQLARRLTELLAAWDPVEGV